MKKLIAIILSVVTLISFTACNKSTQEENTAASPEATESESEAPAEAVNEEELYADAVAVTIELENGGVMKGEIYPHLAPITVENFIKLCNEHFYDGLIFHRVISGFMIQGGGYDKDFNEKPADSIKGEFSANGVNNPLKHTRGVLSMARTPEPDSASSQFFIMHQDAPSLDGQYAAFGKITEGLEYVDQIAQSDTDSNDIPTESIIIKSISVQE